MDTIYTFRIFHKVEDLPVEWDSICSNNVFLSTVYLSVLEQSAPSNMRCHFIGIYSGPELVGVALSQMIDLRSLESYGNRDRRLKTISRNLILKNFVSHILIIGNNMLTGQNAFAIAHQADIQHVVTTIQQAAVALKVQFRSKGVRTVITTIKDFTAGDAGIVQEAGFQKYHRYSFQPNMVFYISEAWAINQDYIDALTKKYRDQYKRARKKSMDVLKKQMTAGDIKVHEELMYSMYRNVAENAYFNTFFLPSHHFFVFKELFKERFQCYGYFLNDRLIGFSTIITNGDELVTYYLGYDKEIQQEKMVYLNMLYDMIAFSINNGFRKLIFARTAMEIKSSVGAKPEKMYGFAKHSHVILDVVLKNTFTYFEPKALWQERNPFR